MTMALACIGSFIAGIFVTLCIAALAVESVGDPHEPDTEYL